MSLNCFATYEQGSEDELEYEDAIGDRMCKVPYEEGRSECRSFCPCGKALKRVAKLPGHAVLLRCQATQACLRCDDEITAGELHFMCSNCEDVHVCRTCGPGVYIGRKFDFFDKSTGELEITEVPARVLHFRTEKQRQRAQARSRSIRIDMEDSDHVAMTLAQQVVKNAKKLGSEVMEADCDMLDRDWGDEGILERLLGSDRKSSFEKLALIVRAATKVFASGPTLQEVQAPCKIYGDTHGQLRDVLVLFGCFGFPGTPECPRVVFNGDIVDRGRHQVELVALLFSMKLAFPDAVFINRGNHEDAHMNLKYGFNKSCIEAVGEKDGGQLFELMGNCFATMPLASCIAGKVFVVHGGIGDGKWNMADLNRVQRPLNHADLQKDSNQWLWNLLWSDPIEDDEGRSSGVFGVHDSPRGKLAVKFGWNVTQAFCAANGLDLVVRSHQAKKHGLGFDVMHNESLMRVFSARDYEGHDNDAAVLSVTCSAEGTSDEGVLEVRPQVLSSISRR